MLLSVLYDIMGRVTSATINDVTTTYEYDKLGREYTEIETSPDHSVFRGFFYEGISTYLS